MPRILSGPGFVIYGHDDSNGSNILLPNEQTPAPFCPNDGTRLVYSDKVMVCSVCEFTRPTDDFKPATGLVVKNDGAILLVQPKKGAKTNEDIPEAATIISDELIQ
jgi:hypothetical protein